MDRYHEMKQMTREFFSILSEHTDAKIDIAMISHDTVANRQNGKCIHLAKGIEISKAYDILKKENAWWKNQTRKENMYFRFSKDQEYNIAFVDDILGDYVNRFIEKNHFILIQTSQSKYQGLFLLDKNVSWQELTYIQKALQGFYNGDPASTDATHLKRIAGFYNTKYNDGFIVKLTHIGSNVISVDQIMAYIRKQMREQQEAEKKSYLMKLKQIAKSSSGTKTEKTWNDFYDGDESIADIRYALYLLRKGFNENEVKNRLREESLDLRKRKGSRVEKYLDRTVDRALSYIS